MTPTTILVIEKNYLRVYTRIVYYTFVKDKRKIVDIF